MVGASRNFRSIISTWHGSGQLIPGSVTDIRLQIDGTPMRTDMAMGSNNMFVSLVPSKTEIGRDGEWHIATYFGQETASNFRKFLTCPIREILEIVRNGVEIEGIKHLFRLLICCDYVALAKLMGCGYHTSHHRCAICYFDVRNPGRNAI